MTIEKSSNNEVIPKVLTEEKGTKKKTFRSKLRTLIIKYTVIIALIFVALKVYGCARLINRNPTAQEAKMAKEVNNVIGAKKTAKELEKHVKFLSDRERARNYLNLDSLNECADYISQQFSDTFYYKVSEQQFETDHIELKGMKYRNIIAQTPYIKDAPYLVVGAHYDCFYNTPGADDNASGVAILLESAKKLAMMQHFNSLKKLNYNIIFIAYSLEEPPFFTTKNMGSYVHAQSLKKANINVEVMICLEMLGYYSEEKDSQHYPVPLLGLFFPNKGNFVASISNSQSKKFAREMDWYIRKFAKLNCEYVPLPDYVKEGAFSDHRNFWELKIPAIMLTDTANFRNDNYHKLTDTYDTLNYQYMAQITDALVMYLLKDNEKNDQ